MVVSALSRKLLRDLWRLKGQVITIALVVACGIASYASLRTTWRSLTLSRTTYYERYRFADVFAHLERAPEELEARIEAIPGVARAYTRVVENVLVPMEGMLEPAIGTLVSIPSSGTPPLNGLYLRTGRLVEPGRVDEAVVIESFANAHGLKPGSRLPVVINGKLRDLRIVGIALSPEYVFAMSLGDIAPDDKGFAVLWMDRAVLAPAFQMENAFNDVALALQPGASEPEVLRALDMLLEPYGGTGAVGRDKQLSNYILRGELSQIEQFATVIPIVFLLVAAFLLNIVLSRLIHLQRQQVAALKALGYSNRQVGVHYLSLVSVIVVIGALLGCALGAWMGSGLTDLYARYFRFPVLVYRFEWHIASTAVLISLLAAFVGALAAVKRVVSLPPAEAMRPQAPANYRRGILERLGIMRLLGPSSAMIVRELQRRPLRTVLSSLGIAAAVGIMVMGRFGYDSFEYLIFEVYHQEIRGDVTVTFPRPVPERVTRELTHLPGVYDVEGTRTVPVRFKNGHKWRDSALYGMPDNPRLRRIVDRQARLVDLPEHGLAVSRKLAEVLDVGPGQRIAIEIREGNRGWRELTITRLVDDAFGMQGYMRMSALHEFLGEQVSINSAQMRIDPELYDEVHRRLEKLPQVAKVTRKQSFIDRFYEQTGSSMWVMTLILTLCAATIAVGVVYNNARVALSMRSRDLASLRVLGFKRSEISAILLGELAIQIILALPIGLLFGHWWSLAIMSTVDPETYRMPIVISTGTYAFAIAVTVGAGLASALLVRRKLDHLDLIGVLKTRE